MTRTIRKHAVYGSRVQRRWPTRSLLAQTRHARYKLKSYGFTVRVGDSVVTRAPPPRPTTLHGRPRLRPRVSSVLFCSALTPTHQPPASLRQDSQSPTPLPPPPPPLTHPLHTASAQHALAQIKSAKLAEAELAAVAPVDPRRGQHLEERRVRPQPTRTVGAARARAAAYALVICVCICVRATAARRA